MAINPICGIFFGCCASANKGVKRLWRTVQKISLPLVSSNHPIRPRQHIGRDREADLLGGFEIYDQFELRWLLNGHFTRICTSYNFVNIDSGAAVHIRKIRSVRREASSFNKLRKSINSWQPVFCRKFHDRRAVSKDKSVIQHHESISTFLCCCSEYSFKIVGATHL